MEIDLLGWLIVAGLIGDQHEFFNQFVCILPLLGDYFQGLALFVQIEFHLHSLKIDSPPVKTGFSELGCQFIECFDLLSEVTRTRLYDFLCFLIGKSPVGMNDRPPKPS